MRSASGIVWVHTWRGYWAIGMHCSYSENEYQIYKALIIRGGSGRGEVVRVSSFLVFLPSSFHFPPSRSYSVLFCTTRLRDTSPCAPSLSVPLRCLQRLWSLINIETRWGKIRSLKLISLRECTAWKEEETRRRYIREAIICQRRFIGNMNMAF